jgi:hypothetical protein
MVCCVIKVWFVLIVVRLKCCISKDMICDENAVDMSEWGARKGHEPWVRNSGNCYHIRN